MNARFFHGVEPIALAAVALIAAGCGSKKATTDATPSSGVVPVAAGGETVDPGQTPVLAQPGALDLTTSPSTQGQIVASGLNSATSAAAAGSTGGGSSAALLLNGNSVELTADAAATQPESKVTKGTLAQDCYAGTAHIQGPTRPNSLTWPEAVAPSVFASSMNAAADTTNATMNVEPALTQYPATSPTVTLPLSAPFAFANLAEVVAKDTRSVTITLHDLAQTTVQTATTNEAHRFWIAKSPMASATSAAVGCVGAGTTTGSDGKWAKIKWADDAQVNGLNLLERFANSGTLVKTFLPKVKGQYATTPTTLNGTLGQTGARLVEYTISKAAVGAVAGATTVRQKLITHAYNDVNQLMDASGNVKSNLNAYDEVRATSPLVIQEYRDTNEVTLRHVVQSGSVLKTGKDASGAVKWFTKFDFAGLTFDKTSTEVCLPIDGTVTMTTFDKEGGTQVKQVQITYSSAPSATAGKIDPVITVAGDDVNGTQAQWMKLHVNSKCDLKS